MMNLDRAYRVAMTGETSEPTAIDNIMAKYQAMEAAKRQNQASPIAAGRSDNGFWGNLGKFAASDTGRTLLGGLAGAAVTGLSGNDLKTSLAGGVLGATGALNGISGRNRYLQEQANRQQRRADEIAERQAQRDFAAEQNKLNIEARRQADNLAFERRLQEIAAERDFRREQNKLEREYALEDRKNNFDFQNKMDERNFDRSMRLTDINHNFERERWNNQAEQARLAREGAKELQRLNWENQAAQAQLTRDYNRETADKAYERSVADWQRNRDAHLQDLDRADALYDRRLTDTRDYEANRLADERAYEAERLAENRAYDEKLRESARKQALQDADRDFANAVYLQGLKNQAAVNKEQNKLDFKRKEAEQKAELEAKEAARQNEMMRPRLEQSIERAKSALKDGTGLGQFGGWGWTTGQGGQNRADIQTAQAQINTMMRGLLKEMGVGSTELNSAAEAAAYRYQISPDMPVEQIARILSDFENDYMSGNLRRDVAAVAGQYGGNSGRQDYSGVSDDELLGGL